MSSFAHAVVLTWFAGFALAQEATVDPNLHTLSSLIEGPAFARVNPGEFKMGSSGGIADEQPVHRVRITQPFEISRVEITQTQWVAVMRDPHRKSPDSVNPSHFKGDTRPVESMSWNQVQEFLKKLNARDPAHVYRLPSEAEWEYAARAGLTEDQYEHLQESAWLATNAKNETHPVGEKEPNGWGLFDMLGNVSEWVQDWYAPDTYSDPRVDDPQGPEAGSYKVYRGCAWLSEFKHCRFAFRAFDFPTQGTYMVGFRLVRTAK